MTLTKWKGKMQILKDADNGDSGEDNEMKRSLIINLEK